MRTMLSYVRQYCSGTVHERKSLFSCFSDHHCFGEYQPCFTDNLRKDPRIPTSTCPDVDNNRAFSQAKVGSLRRSWFEATKATSHQLLSKLETAEEEARRKRQGFAARGRLTQMPIPTSLLPSCELRRKLA